MKYTKPLIVGLLTLGSLSYYVGCAPVQFSKDANCGENCYSVNGRQEHRYEIIPNEGKVDILFVDDNSASMSYEQNRIADRFSTFIQVLDDQNVDYRVAVTTTDIASSSNGPRSINQNGALQNGRLISMGSGRFFISKQNTASSAERISLFRSAIERNETIQCESFLSQHSSPSNSDYQANCPSPDERALYAASLLVENNYNSFIRPEAHLAIVVLSDEDARSSLYSKLSEYALDQKDQINYLMSAVTQRYAGKSLRVHSLIVQPNDSACLNEQNNQVNKVSGSYGYIYAAATSATAGVLGDICSSDYGSQLANIASNIGESVFEHILRCDQPEPIDKQTPMVSIVPVVSSSMFSISGNRVEFDPSLTPGSKAYLQYACPEL